MPYCDGPTLLGPVPGVSVALPGWMNAEVPFWLRKVSITSTYGPAAPQVPVCACNVPGISLMVPTESCSTGFVLKVVLTELVFVVQPVTAARQNSPTIVALNLRIFGRSFLIDEFRKAGRVGGGMRRCPERLRSLEVRAHEERKQARRPSC